MQAVWRHCAALFCAVFILQGCATSSSLSDARAQFYTGQPEAALQTLDAKSVSNRDRVLAHLEKGLIAHTAGNYQDSIISFKSAYALLNRLDYVSVGEQSASLVTNDWVTTYKGEYSEQLWMHTFQMMNFLLINDPQSAAVEARQALKLYEHHGSSLNRDWYTRTLMALSFEAAGYYDSAHIEYKRLMEDAGRDAGMARRAWINAKRLGRESDADHFKNFIRTSANTASSKGELILFLQTGAIPRKRAGEIYVEPKLYASFPIYPDYGRSNISVKVLNNGNTTEADVVKTELVDVARASLADRGRRIAAKQVLRIAAKQELARAIDREVDGLGELFTAAFFLLEQADTRSWQTLPEHTALIQLPLEAGTHSIELQVQNGASTYDFVLDDIDINARRTTYRSIRLGSGSPRPRIGLEQGTISP